MKQLSLVQQTSRSAHGGETRVGKRKIARPLCTKRPIHLVLRSSKARGAWSFHRHRSGIKSALHTSARAYGVRVMGFENVGNHLHLLVQGKNRILLRAFLKVFPQKVMFLVTGAKKGNPQGRFFDHVVFSRVVEWGKALDKLKSYFGKNRMESYGLPADLVERLRHFEWGNGLFVP